MTTKSFVLFAGAAALAGLLAGCRVEKTTNGDSKNVNITTPFGGMHVKTNDADVLSEIGLPAYPGAVAVNKDDDEHKSANVDMNFGGFKLRVKVASFHTDDSTDKVEAFYRNGMKQYGDAVLCQNNQPVGSPAKTAEGLTCSNTQNGHVVVESPINHKMELKAGSEQHQHIVTIDPDGGGTKFSLVALDLPGKITYDDDDTDNSDKRQ